MRHLSLLLPLLVSTASLASGPSAVLPDIALEPDAALWRVDYRFPQPVRELRFARADAKGNRAALWAPLDPAWSIVLEDGAEVVRRADGATFTQVGFRMEPRFVALEKDYAPFSPFGDGGLLIHTGRFFACAPRCDDAEHPEWAFSVKPPRDSHVLQGGRVHDGVARFSERDDGGNLYVGQARPIETPQLLAVIDARFPPRARALLEDSFPRLMDFYSARLGALARKPMMFASNDEAHPGGGYGHQGGTLPGQVFVHLYGPRPDDADSVSGAEALRGFFAHEAAHLYQRYEAGTDQDDAWMHEGGADAFALLALEAVGLADEAERRQQVEASLHQCADLLGGEPLRAAARRGAFGAYYRCGQLMHLAVDAAARARGDCDLFCVWRAFLQRVDAGEGYSARTWFATVESLAGADTARFVREAATEAHPDAVAFFTAGLRQAGVLPPAATAAGGADAPGH